MAEMVGIKVIHVPLGSGKRVASALRGEVEAISVPTPEVAGQVKAGELRILAIPSEAPDPAFPGAPTLKQLGVPMSMELFRGISVPKGTPVAVIGKLADAFQKAAHDKSFEGVGEKEGFLVSTQGPVEFRKYLADQDAFIADMAKRAGLGKGR
jgi:tripartite-type tricarboxylate transporter receptor subunit TctC